MNEPTKISVFLRHAADGSVTQMGNMITEGFSVNTKQKDGLTALMVASRMGRPKMLSFLFTKNADVSMADINGNTALHEAFFGASADCVAILLENGADLHAPNKDKEAPFLFWTNRTLQDRSNISFKHANIKTPSAGLLLMAQAGADVFAKNAQGKSAADMILEEPDCFGVDLVTHVKALVDHKAIGSALLSSGMQNPGRKL